MEKIKFFRGLQFQVAAFKCGGILRRFFPNLAVGIKYPDQYVWFTRPGFAECPHCGFEQECEHGWVECSACNKEFIATDDAS